MTTVRLAVAFAFVALAGAVSIKEHRAGTTRMPMIHPRCTTQEECDKQLRGLHQLPLGAEYKSMISDHKMKCETTRTAVGNDLASCAPTRRLMVRVKSLPNQAFRAEGDGWWNWIEHLQDRNDNLAQLFQDMENDGGITTETLQHESESFRNINFHTGDMNGDEVWSYTEFQDYLNMACEMVDLFNLGEENFDFNKCKDYACINGAKDDPKLKECEEILRDTEAYCESELDKAEDDAKVLSQQSADLEKAIEEDNEMIATLASEIEALEDGIKALDKSVSEATETRKSEHEFYVETMAADNAAKELIGVAKNRLAKFYTPKLYKAAPKRELTAEERVSVNMGGTMAPTAPPGGIAGTGVTVLVQVKAHKGQGEVAPPPPPSTWDAYAKKGEENTGVTTMLDMLVADLDKEIQEMTVDEKDAQAEYETFIADSAAKRAADAKSIAEKESTKADLGAEVVKLTAENKATLMALMDKHEYIKDLHLDCDWLLSNFEARKAARAGEVESLKNAKAVLSGADYSLVQQTAARAPLRLRGAK